MSDYKFQCSRCKQPVVTPEEARHTHCRHCGRFEWIEEIPHSSTGYPEDTKPARLDEKQIGGDHYRKHKFTPWEIIDEYQLDFYTGNTLKYLLRAKDKNGLQDLEKAKHYLEKLIELQRNA